ncbi:MAG: TlpA family protein disulfide reductase [Actinomycetota bacterium]|nr:TlpA family protein disulfide reductase [Actinomycetota bacterium]
MTSPRTNKRTARSRQEFRTVPWFRIAIGVMVVLGGVAIALSAAEQDADDGAATAPVTVDGEPLPEFAGDPGSDRGIGQPAPAVTGLSIDGQPLSIRPQGDGPTAVVFLAHWCPHCQAEVTEVQGWLEDEQLPTGVNLRAVSTLVEPSRPNFPPAAWLEREGWSVPTLVDDGNSSVAEAYGLSGTPFWVFADDEGRAVLRTSGRLPLDQLQAILQRLASEG